MHAMDGKNCKFFISLWHLLNMKLLIGRMMDGRELRVQLARYGRPDDPPSRRSGRSSRRRR